MGKMTKKKMVQVLVRSAAAALALSAAACTNTSGPAPATTVPATTATTQAPTATAQPDAAASTTARVAITTTMATPTTVNPTEADTQLILDWFDRYNTLIKAKEWETVVRHMALSAYGTAAAPSIIECAVRRIVDTDGGLPTWIPSSVRATPGWIHPVLGGVPDGRIYLTTITQINLVGVESLAQAHFTIVDGSARWFTGLSC